MGFSFRKSFKAGPFRINLSKSGVGFSGGIKGARVSVGPRGTQLRAGRKGVYYQKTLSTRQPATAAYSYPSVDLERCRYLTAQSGYFDVCRTIGMPDEMRSTTSLEAKIPNTILLYHGKGAVFLIYENEMILGKAMYLGTKAFYPERVLHVSLEEFGPILEAGNLQQHDRLPVAGPPLKKRRWPIYVGALAVLGIIGSALNPDSTNNSYSPASTVTASPSPSNTPVSALAKPKGARKSKRPVVSNSQVPAAQSSDPVIISEAPRIASPRASSGRSYIMGPRGGCYYIGSTGRKVYVDRSLCR